MLGGATCFATSLEGLGGKFVVLVPAVAKRQGKTGQGSKDGVKRDAS